MSGWSTGVKTVVEQVESEFDEALVGRVYSGIPAITRALRDHGLGAFSERTVRRLLSRSQLPAVRQGKTWITSALLLDGMADAVVRARVQGMCLCGLCPAHREGRR